MPASPVPPARGASVFDHARTLLTSGEVDLVTSDVFDTIVTRHCARPADAFTELGRRLRDAGVLAPTTEPAAFRSARVAAERMARLRILDDRAATTGFRGDHARDHAAECTLEEIWAEMSPRLGIDPAVGIATELDVEADWLRPLPDAIATLELALDLGLGVHLVSDIYLSGEQLTELLGRVGVPVERLTSVVTSSDHRLGKAGGLLARVVDDAGAEPSRVLHLGDNPVADVATALSLGARAIEAELNPDLVVVDRLGDGVADYSERSGTDLGVTAAVRETLLGAGDIACFPAYQFGAVALGPPMFGFARWLVHTAGDLGVGTLHLLLREGATIGELVRSAHPRSPIPDLRTVHASRWVDVRAACFEGTVEEIAEMLGRRDPLTPEDAAITLGCPVEPLRRIIGDLPVPPIELRDLAAAIHHDEELRSGIVTFCADLRSRVLRQLRAELDLDADRIVLADVGWGGRIQAAIEQILRSGGHDQPVTGLYLALSRTGEQRVADGTDMRSYLPHRFDDAVLAGGGSLDGDVGREIAHHADTVERVLTPDIATFVDVGEDGTAVVADRPEPQPPGVGVARTAMFDAVDTFAALDPDDRWVTDAEWRAAVGESLRSTILTPHPLLARDLSAWQHDDVGGSRAVSLAAGDELAERIRLTTVRELDTLVDQHAVWVDGAAAEHHPALLAQRHAMRHGLGVDVVAPIAPGGLVRLSVFSEGRDDAALQQVHDVGVTTGGWNAIRVAGDVESLRGVRFDPGEVELLVELGSIRVRATDGDDSDAGVVLDHLDHDRLAFVDARRLDDRRFVADRGGHLVLPVTGDALGLAAGGPIEALVVFRRWRLGPDDPLLVEPRSAAARRVATRSVQRARRLARRIGR